MFSVIIPLYNKAEYVKTAIQSVLLQHFADFELIIVNDGSTDNSLEVARQFADPRIRIINQKNLGVSTARNNGVKIAISNYIAFLDADDWWGLDYLSEISKLIKKYPEAGLWATKYYKVKRGQNKEANIRFENKNFIDGYINYFRVYAKTMWMPITSSSFIVKRTVFNKFKGYKSILKIGEDFDLWVRISLNHKVAYLNQALVYYNQDVDEKDRAIVNNKIWHPYNHFVFQLDYLLPEEQINVDLKTLLDKIRVYTLLRYYLSGLYITETNYVLKQVDFKNQPFTVQLLYKSPLILIKGYFKFRQFLSLLKSKLIK